MPSLFPIKFPIPYTNYDLVSYGVLCHYGNFLDEEMNK